MRHRILIGEHEFYAPLARELAKIGVDCTPLQSWNPEQSSDVLACCIGLYEALSRPLEVFLLSRRLRKLKIPLICWNRDAPHYLNKKPWRLDLLNRFRLFDLYATHTLIDTRRQFADAVLYLPNAADIENYGLGGAEELTLLALRDPSVYEWDVTFFGGMDGQRYKEDQARAEFFAALAPRLDTLGIRYCFRETGGMSPAEQQVFIRKSRINLNYGARCEYQAPVASGLPERCYGIPASGGFLLCDKRTHARDDFTVGQNWAEFDGVDDCLNQIQYWLSHFDAARTVAERCHEHVMAHHHYGRRAQRLLLALEAWHAGQRGLLNINLPTS